MQRGAIDAPRRGWSWLGCGMDRPQCLYDHLYRYGSRRGGTSWGGGEARNLKHRFFESVCSILELRNFETAEVCLAMSHEP